MTRLVFGAVFGSIIEWRRGELMSYRRSTCQHTYQVLDWLLFMLPRRLVGLWLLGR